jgi:hypothetical protein
MNAINTHDLVIHNGEPRLLDLKVAEALEYAEPRAIRKLIQRNLDEFMRYGEVFATVANTSADDDNRASVARIRDTVSQTTRKVGRPGNEFYLNEAQSLLACSLSDTPKAPDARQMIILGFMAGRKGDTAAADYAPNDDLGNPFKITSEAVPVWQTKLQIVRECRHLWGHDRARALWRQLGMAVLPEQVIGGQDEAKDCLWTILCIPVGGEPLYKRVMQALNGDDEMGKRLRPLGVWVDADEDGFIIANRHTGIEKALADTRWKDAQWSYTLRRLPGAMPALPRRYEPAADMPTSRGTFLRSRVLDLFAEN